MNHSKPKRIAAIIGIALLVALYLITLCLAIFGNENTHSWFMACICATIVVPILIWVYLWLYKMLKKDVEEATEKGTGSRKRATSDQFFLAHARLFTAFTAFSAGRNR